MERWQAARHSALVMWVALSQNPMQACSDLPPPPATLGWSSEELCVVIVGGVTVSLRTTVPPELSTTVGSGGESGARAGAGVIGAARAEGGGWGGTVTGTEGDGIRFDNSKPSTWVASALAAALLAAAGGSLAPRVGAL